MNILVMTDQALLAEVEAAAQRERRELPHFLACLGEVERRGLHLDRGHRNLFEYCVFELKFSEGAAIQRVYAARAASKYPEIYAYLSEGELNLNVVSRLSPYLESNTASQILSRAVGKRRDEIEELVVELSAAKSLLAAVPEHEDSPECLDQHELVFNPDQPMPSEIRSEAPEATPNTPDPNASDPNPSGANANEAGLRYRRDVIRLEAQGVLKIAFWASPSFREKLEIVRRLAGRTNGRIEAILEIVFDEFIQRHSDIVRGGPLRRSAGGKTRHIPKNVRDTVWRRDAGRCAFTSPEGIRCEARSRLEYDHVQPWACGGASDDPANIRLLCRAHNLRLARKAFGDRVPPARPV